MTALVSVIIPCYNYGRFLSDALDSVLAQTYGDWEAIVIDDGSTDDTDAVAERYAAKDARIRYISQENRGVSAARNHGFRVARGDYVLFLDSDDLLLPNALGELVRAHGSETDVVFSDGWIVGPDGARLASLSSSHRVPGLEMEAFLFGRVAGLHSALFRYPCLLAVEGPFDEEMPEREDLDMFLRLRASGTRFAYVAVHTCVYRFHGRNKSLPGSPYLERRRLSLMRSRMRSIDAPWFDELSTEARYRFFQHVLVELLPRDRAAQARVMGHSRFKAMTPRERSRLLFELAAEEMVGEAGWLADAGLLLKAIRLRPQDPRLYAMLLVDALPVPTRRWLLRKYRRWRSGPPKEVPWIAALAQEDGSR